MPASSQTKAKARRTGLRVGILVSVLVLILAVYAVGGHHWLSVESLRSHRDMLLRFVDGHYWESLSLVAAATVVLVAVSMPASAPLMLLSGMVFGRLPAIVLMALTASLGATVAMLVVRYLAEDFVRARLRGHRHAEQLIKGFERHRNSYLLFLRVAPAFPFWITNILFGLTDIVAWRFLLLTVVGILPDSVIYCNIGANLAHVKSAHDLLSPATILTLLLLAILCLTPVLLRQLQQRGVIRQGWPFGNP
ncbi:MAG TPA: VTT domain-containing protein [Gammaproteobacteria bacterium]|nr:VTT domain-containing protein [Gammaproteobacteria bacterium]